MSPPRASILAALLASLAACSPSPDAPATLAAAGAAGASGAAGGAGDAGAAGDAGCGGATVTLIRGEALAEQGELPAETVMQACLDRETGDLCLAPVPVSADGGYSRVISKGISCVQRAAVRVTSFTPGYASIYCEARRGEGGVYTASPAVLVRVPAAKELPALGDPAQERVVTFEGGISLRVTPERFSPDGGGYAGLGARWVDPGIAGLCFLDGSPPLEGLVAFLPEGDIEGNFGFRLPNRTGLAAGTRVRFFALGGLYCSLTEETTLREGRWEVIGEGQVDAAGKFVEPDDGVGMPCLTWLGYGLPGL